VAAGGGALPCVTTVPCPAAALCVQQQQGHGLGSTAVGVVVGGRGRIGGYPSVGMADAGSFGWMWRMVGRWWRWTGG
jgi:hypothetical protein